MTVSEYADLVQHRVNHLLWAAYHNEMAGRPRTSRQDWTAQFPELMQPRVTQWLDGVYMNFTLHEMATIAWFCGVRFEVSLLVRP